MPKIVRAAFDMALERPKSTAIMGLGGLLFSRAFSGYLDRRAWEREMEDRQKHIAEMALEKQAQLELPAEDELAWELEFMDDEQKEATHNDR